MISLSSASLLASAPGRSSIANKTGRATKDAIYQQITAVLGPWKSIQTLGQHCAQITSLVNKSLWTRRFIKNLADSAISADKRTTAALRDQYQRRLRDDFSNNRITNVGGYILSRSEAETYRAIQEMLVSKSG